MVNANFGLCLLVGLLLQSGCASAPAKPSDPPSHVPAHAGARLALVLSGGSARGYAHLGVLRALEREGIRPDLIVGSSAGSIVGALYASGLTAAEVDRALEGLNGSQFLDLAWPRFGVLPGELGLIRGDGLRNYLATHLRTSNISSFPIRFAAVATDLDSGEPQAFNAGDGPTAVQASAAIPGIMVPVEVGGRRYADGQVSSPVPVQIARQLGAEVIVAVDVIYPPGDSSLTNPFRVVFQAFLISTYRLREFQLRSADVVITPRLPSTSGQLGTASKDDLARAGELAAVAALPELRRALGIAATRYGTAPPGSTPSRMTTD